MATIASVALLFGLVALATIVFATDSLPRCFDEAGRGTVGMVAAAVSGIVLPVLLVVAVLRLRRGHGATALPILLGFVAVVCVVALFVGASEEACQGAALSSEDGDGRVAFVPNLNLAANLVVATCAVAAAVLLRRRRTASSSAGRGTPPRPPT